MIPVDGFEIEALISFDVAGEPPYKSERLKAALLTVAAFEGRVYATIQDDPPNRFPSAVYILQSSFQPSLDPPPLEGYGYFDEVYLVIFNGRSAAQAEFLWRSAVNALHDGAGFVVGDGGRDYFEEDAEVYQKLLTVTVRDHFYA